MLAFVDTGWRCAHGLCRDMEESRVGELSAGSSSVAVFGHVTNLNSDFKSSDMLVLGTCRWEYHVRFPTTVASHMHDCRLCLPTAGA